MRIPLSAPPPARPARTAPVRTCIATRTRHRQSDLLRVVGEQPSDGETTRVIPDPCRRRPGRGAWVTPTAAAVATAEKRRAFHRALRLTGRVDVSAVTDYVAQRDSRRAD